MDAFALTAAPPGLTTGPTWESFLLIQAAAVLASILGSSVIAAIINSRSTASTASDTRIREQLALVHDSLDALSDAYAKRRKKQMDDDAVDRIRREFVAACSRCLDDGVTETGAQYVVIGDLYASGDKINGFAQEEEAQRALAAALNRAGKRYSGSRSLARQGKRRR